MSSYLVILRFEFIMKERMLTNGTSKTQALGDKKG